MDSDERLDQIIERLDTLIELIQRLEREEPVISISHVCDFDWTQTNPICSTCGLTCGKPGLVPLDSANG